MLTKYISIPTFLCSFIIGLIFVYILGPETKVIYKYPSPSNYNDILYKDKADNCFEIKPVETGCPINPLSIKKIPVQN
jgi:hypothetical protein